VAELKSMREPSLSKADPEVSETALSRFRVGAWSVDRSAGRLVAEGREVRLEPLVMDLLVCLARWAPQVVSRETLLHEVWKDRIVGDDAISSAVAALRRSLCDNARSPRFIETISKRGYRLLVEPSSVPEERRSESAETGAPRIARGYRTRRWVLLGLAWVVTAAALLAVVPRWAGWYVPRSAVRAFDAARLELGRQPPDLDAARRHLENAVRLAPGSLPYRRSLLRVVVEQDDRAAIQIHARAVLARAPDDPEAIAALAVLATPSS
jgi:DNA-binding winged helix-turn-helix (wHTH) protein